MVLKCLDYIGDCGSLLTDGHIHTEELFLNISGVKVSLLVDDCVNCDSSFTSLTITDDQLTLSSSNWHETINCLQTCLHWFIDGLARYDSRGFNFDSFPLACLDRPQAINWVTQCIEYSPQHFLSDRDIHNGTRSCDSVSLLNFSESNLKYLSLPKMTTPTLSVSRLRAMPLIPDLNSTISPACTLLSPTTRAIPSPMLMTVPNSFTSFYLANNIPLV